MLDYLSDYRTQDKMHGVHYYPSGALCWFETNQYGDPTGTVYYVRKIPDMELLEKPFMQRGLKKLKQKKIYNVKDSLIRTRPDMEVLPTKKPRFDNNGKE